MSSGFLKIFDFFLKWVLDQVRRGTETGTGTGVQVLAFRCGESGTGNGYGYGHGKRYGYQKGAWVRVQIFRYGNRYGDRYGY